MKTKQNVSLKNLNSIFTDPLKKFDILHRQIMGTEAVVTSVDTGRHWGSIKKQKRPFGWEDFTEMQVRELSDSKHYNTPCDAVDFRRREPDTNSHLYYYDDLTESEQRYFKTEIYECFPDEHFDVVFSRLCIHVEWDPDFDVRKTRGLTKEDLKPREIILPVGKGSWVEPVNQIKLPDRKVVVGTLERLWFELDSKAVLMGAANFLTARLTGFRFLKNKIGVKNDQSVWSRLIELLNVLITKLKEW